MQRTFISATLIGALASIAVIVPSTVSMVHALEMSVVAAGIETSMIAARAVTMGVDALQGYHLAAPMPAAAVPRLVRRLAISA